ncbi:MAG: iron ABC transporter permease [Pseudomonadota bacterium]
MSASVEGSVFAVDTQRQRRRYVVLGLFVTLLGTAAFALVTGAIDIALTDFFASDPARAMQHTVLTDIRGPRVLMAACVGASLAVAGGALQGLFRNPLADPGLIGVSSGAAVGALSMIVFGAGIVVSSSMLVFLVPLSAVVGAGLVTLFLYSFARFFSNFSVMTMLLVGIAINALGSVAIGAFNFLSDDQQLRTLVFWLMGSYGRATWASVLPAAAIAMTATVILLKSARGLDVLQLGESEARALGVDVERLKRRVILTSAAAVGAGVAVAGIVAFVGLVVPHLVRLMGGAPNRFVLPAAGLLGAALSILADLVARTAVVPAELPVSLVTSALGAPFFLWLIARMRTR